MAELLCPPRNSLPEISLVIICGSGSSVDEALQKHVKESQQTWSFWGKTSLLWLGGQQVPSPKGIHFPGVWDQIIYSSFCSSIISSKQGQLFQTCVTNSPPRGPVPEHRWNSSGEKTAGKTGPLLSLKVWFWRTIMISPLRPALLFFLFVFFFSPGIWQAWKNRRMELTEHSFDSGGWLAGLIAAVGITVRKMHK